MMKLSAEDVIHVIGHVLHDSETKPQEMMAKAADYYFAEFAAKRTREELCIFVGALIGILSDNLSNITVDLRNGPAN